MIRAAGGALRRGRRSGSGRSQPPPPPLPRSFAGGGPEKRRLRLSHAVDSILPRPWELLHASLDRNRCSSSSLEGAGFPSSGALFLGAARLKRGIAPSIKASLSHASLPLSLFSKLNSTNFPNSHRQGTRPALQGQGGAGGTGERGNTFSSSSSSASSGGGGRRRQAAKREKAISPFSSLAVACLSQRG